MQGLSRLLIVTSDQVTQISVAYIYLNLSYGNGIINEYEDRGMCCSSLTLTGGDRDCLSCTNTFRARSRHYRDLQADTLAKHKISCQPTVCVAIRDVLVPALGFAILPSNHQLNSTPFLDM